LDLESSFKEFREIPSLLAQGSSLKNRSRNRLAGKHKDHTKSDVKTKFIEEFEVSIINSPEILNKFEFMN
jgi:hypothetical protein